MSGTDILVILQPATLQVMIQHHSFRGSERSSNLPEVTQQQGANPGCEHWFPACSSWEEGHSGQWTSIFQMSVLGEMSA